MIVFTFGKMSLMKMFVSWNRKKINKACYSFHTENVCIVIIFSSKADFYVLHSWEPYAFLSKIKENSYDEIGHW